jgi:hypothetical protein
VVISIEILLGVEMCTKDVFNVHLWADSKSVWMRGADIMWLDIIEYIGCVFLCVPDIQYEFLYTINEVIHSGRTCKGPSGSFSPDGCRVIGRQHGCHMCLNVVAHVSARSCREWGSWAAVLPGPEEATWAGGSSHEQGLNVLLRCFYGLWWCNLYCRIDLWEPTIWCAIRSE